MALIGKIRKNFWFVLLLLGFALAAFIIMDMTSAGNPGGAMDTHMGSVAGQDIDYNDFSKAEQVLFSGSGNSFANKQSLWDYFVEQAIVNNESEKLGITVPKDELLDLQFGQNLSPLITQQLQSGALNFDLLNQVKTAIETDEFTNPQLRTFWAEQEKQIIKTQKQTKLNNLVAKGVYTPKWLAEESFKESNGGAKIAFVKIPFDQITETVEVSDSDISNYIALNKELYTNKKEKRKVEYFTFNVKPTAEDTATVRSQAEELRNKFAAATSDSLFLITNKSNYTNLYTAKSNLPAGLQDAIAGMNNGDIYGPVLENGNYVMHKRLDARIVPDTVRAQHILRRVTPNDPNSLAAATKIIDSLYNLAVRGVESFDSLAIKNSEDGSAAQGGDLGAFVQGAMVPEFNDVCFLTGKRGGLYKTTTQFGVHLIKVGRQTFNDRNNKYRIGSVSVPVIPSKNTQDAMYDSVVDLISGKKNVTELKEALASRNDVVTQISNELEDHSYNVGTLGAENESREIVKWAFNPSTEIGDFSAEIYSYTDKINYFDNKYVIASLESIQPKGPLSAAIAKDRVYTAVLNKKKGELASKAIAGKDLNSIAAQYNVSIDTADVNLTSGFVQGIGTEQKVYSLGMAGQANGPVNSVVGSSGLFAVQTVSKNEAGPAINIPAIRSTAQNASRTGVAGSLIQALKKMVDVEDKRSVFF